MRGRPKSLATLTKPELSAFLRERGYPVAQGPVTTPKGSKNWVRNEAHKPRRLRADAWARLKAIRRQQRGDRKRNARLHGRTKRRQW